MGVTGELQSAYNSEEQENDEWVVEVGARGGRYNEEEDHGGIQGWSRMV